MSECVQHQGYQPTAPPPQVCETCWLEWVAAGEGEAVRRARVREFMRRLAGEKEREVRRQARSKRGEREFRPAWMAEVSA